jgi:hypothetical protein
MKVMRSGFLLGLLIFLLLSATLEARQPKPRKSDTTDRGGEIPKTELLGTADPSARDWVRAELGQGHSVLLTNSYLFQMTKGTCQENQISTEEGVLIPLLAQTLKDFVKASSDPETKRLFGIALLLLVDQPGIELPEEVARQAETIRADPTFKPRGHYTDSEDLRRYFVTMQFLAKATIDVAIARPAFPFPEEMLFPFPTAQSVITLFSDPAHAELVEHWKLVHSFYSSISGPADLPTFVDLSHAQTGDTLTKQDVEEWARKHGLPRVNPERGLGIQPFGERFTLHEGVIDAVKRQFMGDDTPRETIANLLKFENLVQGYRDQGPAIEGFDELIAKENPNGYYLATLKAIATGAAGWKDNPDRLNFYASSLTALAEQTALMTKTSLLVRKSPEASGKIPRGLKLYFEQDAEPLLRALREANRAMTDVCNGAKTSVAEKLRQNVRIKDVGPSLEALGTMARQGKPLAVDDALWKLHASVAEELPRKQLVTVDVFQLKEAGGRTSHYQWAIAPFEAQFTVKNAPERPKGLVSVFFEGWSDELVPGSDGPLDNLQWEGRVLEGNLDGLSTVVRIPGEKRK